MRPKLLRALALAPLVAFAAPAPAEDAGYGNLEFSRMTKPQEAFFWRRLKSLATEAAVLSYCGEPDSFETQAKQGIRACVTEAALAKADETFKSEMSAAEASLRLRKTSCRGKGGAERGWLGVEIGAAPKGALVTSAVAGSPAAAAGLTAGDVVATVNGESVAGPKELSAKIRALAPGSDVALGVLREGAARSVSIKLGGMAFDASGQVALDMPALVSESRQDLQAIAGEVTKMCQQCKTSIWAMFCR
jgi:PDZ domain